MIELVADQPVAGDERPGGTPVTALPGGEPTLLHLAILLAAADRAPGSVVDVVSDCDHAALDAWAAPLGLALVPAAPGRDAPTLPELAARAAVPALVVILPAGLRALARIHGNTPVDVGALPWTDAARLRECLAARLDATIEAETAADLAALDAAEAGICDAFGRADRERAALGLKPLTAARLATAARLKRLRVAAAAARDDRRAVLQRHLARLSAEGFISPMSPLAPLATAFGGDPEAAIRAISRLGLSWQTRPGCRRILLVN
jgi:hypothetical protein